MQGIPSGAKFGNATAKQGERPKHTQEGHEHCTYYLTQEDQGTDLIMQCPHTEVAEGGFYSEDLMWDLRRAAHELILTIRTINLSPRQYQRLRNEMGRLEKLTR